VIQQVEKKERQDDGERVRFWAKVEELGGRYLRVVTLTDEMTIHNAFPDRRYKSLKSNIFQKQTVSTLNWRIALVLIPEKLKKELFWISTIKDKPLALTLIKPPST
jgi:hypothetical protein